jgi:hypothetical protein
MKAIVPMNVAALRVSGNDVTNVTSNFRGATVAFDALPHGPNGTSASTGNTIAIPLEGGHSPSAQLELGVHLHWELPDFFRRGAHDGPDGPIRFPQAPNRWLVTRTSSAGRSPGGPGTVTHRSWVVESDFVAPVMPPDRFGVTRPAVAVPLPAPLGAPSMLMGRVVDADDWDPAASDPANYLPHYRGPDGKPYYLNAVGFVGAAFSGYYPDCRSVFGFWDTLRDLPEYPQLAQPVPVDLTLSYTVIGWIADPAADPLLPLGRAVNDAYNYYVDQCAAEKVKVARTPLDFFHRITAERLSWTFSDAAYTATLDAAGGKITAWAAPESALCSGVLQDVVWSGSGPFLAPAGSGQHHWRAEVELAVGNTTSEAVAALVKHLLPPPTGEGVLDNYELLLEALQLGVLRDLDTGTTTLATMAEQRHSRSFAHQSGGHVWTVQAPTSEAPDQRPVEATLPLDLAEQLHLLNRAQQAYESGRALVVAARQQLFMDWTIFVQQWVTDQQNPNAQHVVPTVALGEFIDTSGGGELHEVQKIAASTGQVTYLSDGSSATVGVSTTSPEGTLAGDLVAAFGVVQAHLQAHSEAHSPRAPGWRLLLTPAPRFAAPTDPVLVMQGAQIEPARRNGTSATLPVRVDGELIARLKVSVPGGQAAAVLQAADAAAPIAPATTPAMTDATVVSALLGEAALLSPQSAGLLASALAVHGFQASSDELIAAVQHCQGGRSPLDKGALDGGLFAAAAGASPFVGPEPVQQTAEPTPLHVVFSNAGATALAPSRVGWSAQRAYPELSATRVDPFLPLWMSWEVALRPLSRPDDDRYPTTTIVNNFQLDENGIDLTYLVANGAPAVPVAFTPTTSRGTALLSRRALASLTSQIDRYTQDFAADPADPELLAAKAAYDALPVMAQSIGTFNLAQTLRAPIPMIPVEDLVAGFDPVTDDVAAAALADAADTWYSTAFNALAPLPNGDVYFSPLRGGFLDIKGLTIVDAFGQVMDIDTAQHTSRGGLAVTPSLALRPRADDTANADSIYLPPRVLAPARVDANWLSAVHNDEVPGVSADFVEVNSHPATSPVCGWIVPNHLDVCLAFYDAGGTPIGSFSEQHGGHVYTTHAGNLNLHDLQLRADIGPPGQSANVNPHVARLMWFVAGQKAGFLREFMAGIARSEALIQPARSAQDPALAVLFGQPLAITRATLGLSTAGGVLPTNQLNSGPLAALKTSVDAGWTRYLDRQQHTSAGLQSITFPARVGNPVDIDDGLVAFLPEAADGSYSTVFMPTATAGADEHLQPPGPGTTQLQLNAPAQVLTLIVDPRAAVHITTGVVPTATLSIPPDQYSEAMRSLAVSFNVHPVLQSARGLKLPVPAIPGFDWSWVGPGAAPAALAGANDAERATFGYAPQTLVEGWLQLRRQLELPPQQGGGGGGGGGGSG